LKRCPQARVGAGFEQGITVTFELFTELNAAFGIASD
jgi:hypothetical protein